MFECSRINVIQFLAALSASCFGGSMGAYLSLASQMIEELTEEGKNDKILMTLEESSWIGNYNSNTMISFSPSCILC